MSTGARQDGPVNARGTLVGWTLPLKCCSGDSSSPQLPTPSVCPVPLCCALLNRGTAAPRCLSWCACVGTGCGSHAGLLQTQPQDLGSLQVWPVPPTGL